MCHNAGMPLTMLRSQEAERAKELQEQEARTQAIIKSEAVAAKPKAGPSLTLVAQDAGQQRIAQLTQAFQAVKEATGLCPYTCVHQDGRGYNPLWHILVSNSGCQACTHVVSELSAVTVQLLSQCKEALAVVSRPGFGPAGLSPVVKLPDYVPVIDAIASSD